MDEEEIVAAVFASREPSKIFEVFEVDRTDGEFPCDNNLTFIAANSDEAISGMIVYTDTAFNSTRAISDWLVELTKGNYTTVWIDDEGKSSYFFCASVTENSKLIEFVVVNPEEGIEFQGIFVRDELIKEMRNAVDPVFDNEDNAYVAPSIRQLWENSQKKN